jgi:hypothetical protein
VARECRVKYVAIAFLPELRLCAKFMQTYPGGQGANPFLRVPKTNLRPYKDLMPFNDSLLADQMMVFTICLWPCCWLERLTTAWAASKITTCHLDHHADIRCPGCTGLCHVHSRTPLHLLGNLPLVVNESHHIDSKSVPLLVSRLFLKENSTYSMILKVILVHTILSLPLLLHILLLLLQLSTSLFLFL